MAVQIAHINKSFGSQQVLRDVTLSIPEGQVLGLLGPNGAGKSTLMKILIGLWRADSGSVAVPERIGYLPENNPLYDEMYVAEYLEFMAGLTLNSEALNSAANKREALNSEALNSEALNGVANKREALNSEAINTLIDRVGLTPERHKHIRELSKGYRQRVGLAQALLGNPQLLILDEPTTGLDPNQLVEIRSLIKNLAHGEPLNPNSLNPKPLTIILSTHIMQEVSAMCDRVVILDHGVIKADQPINQIPDLETLFHEATKWQNG